MKFAGMFNKARVVEVKLIIELYLDDNINLTFNREGEIVKYDSSGVYMSSLAGNIMGVFETYCFLELVEKL